MPNKIAAPTRIEAAGNKPKLIDELVGRGMLRVEHEGGVIDVRPGEAITCEPGEWIRYSTPSDEGAEYIAVCLPAFSPDTVNRDGP